ncbi:MAG: DUF485 domain-containing protein [Gammaproteobacteria bacterium]
MNDAIRSLAIARWRIALALSGAVFLLYFGFIAAVAFAREAMAREIVPGLSVGILSGALVIVGAWVTTWIYVRWANEHFDRRRAEIGQGAPAAAVASSAGPEPGRNCAATTGNVSRHD